MTPKSDLVVVFDLDDTLYKERDYVASGIAAVTKHCLDLGLVSRAQAEKPFVPDIAGGGFIDALCSHLSLPVKLQATLLWLYRLHVPALKLDTPTAVALDEISTIASALAIITDGRSVTQRLKIRALGLQHVTAYVSEEHERGKPAADMFVAVENRWPDCRYTYIGDNPAKDFIAPNARGWLSIGLKDNGRNIHSQSHDVADIQGALPKAWAEDFSAIPGLISGYWTPKEPQL